MHEICLSGSERGAKPTFVPTPISQVGTLRRTARRNAAAKRGSYRAWAVGDQCFEAVFGKGYRDVPRSTLTHYWLVIPVVRTTSGGEGNRELVEQLNLDKRQLGQLLLQPAQKLSAETNQRIETLEGEVEKIESQLAQHVAGLGQVRHALGVSLEQVQSTIPNDGALIEYVRYGHYLGKRKLEPGYGATCFVLRGCAPVDSAR
jgi:hypothetical protein